MSRRDDFDDPEGFQSAFGKIASAMEQSRDGIRRRGPLIGVLTAGVALFVLFAVFWSTYPRGGGEGGGVDGPVPLIRADASPFRTAPDDPGGMQIPYRDSTIFETIRNTHLNQGEGRVESLLPPPEEPVDRDRIFAGLKTEPIEDEPAPAPEAAAPPALNSGPAPHPDTATAAGGEILSAAPVEDVKPDPKPEPKIEPTVEAKTAPKPAPPPISAPAGGTHYVQLGSVKDRSGAEAEWKKLQRDFPAQLGALTLRIQEVNLGDKGTFYRIQGGAVAQDKAREICAAIIAKKPGGCLVVAK